MIFFGMNDNDNGTIYTDFANHSALSAIPVHARIISGHESLANHGKDMIGKDCMVSTNAGGRLYTSLYCPSLNTWPTRFLTA